MRRTLLFGILAIALLGCAEDDPFATTVQSATTTEAPAGDGADGDGPVTDATADPVADDSPEPDDDPLSEFPRPAEIVDLRGQALVEIIVTENIFTERYFRVDPGTQILFRNEGSDAHNVKPAIAGAFPTIDKDALNLEPQALVLTEPGDYPFYCSLHGTSKRGQTGYVIVGEG
ncbi:MAG: hypothetical protein AAF548_14195 [Actinomycetota bacterium]